MDNAEKAPAIQAILAELETLPAAAQDAVAWVARNADLAWALCSGSALPAEALREERRKALVREDYLCACLAALAEILAAEKGRRNP